MLDDRTVWCTLSHTSLMLKCLAQGEASKEVEEYEVGKIAYGDEDNNQSGMPDFDPAEVEDEGSTSTGLQGMLSNPTLPLTTKMQVRSPQCLPV